MEIRISCHWNLFAGFSKDNFTTELFRDLFWVSPNFSLRQTIGTDAYVFSVASTEPANRSHKRLKCKSTFFWRMFLSRLLSLFLFGYRACANRKLGAWIGISKIQTVFFLFGCVFFFHWIGCFMLFRCPDRRPWMSRFFLLEGQARIVCCHLLH